MCLGLEAIGLPVFMQYPSGEGYKNLSEEPLHRVKSNRQVFAFLVASPYQLVLTLQSRACPSLSLPSQEARCLTGWMDWFPGLQKVGSQWFSFITGWLRKEELSQLASKREHNRKIWPTTASLCKQSFFQICLWEGPWSISLSLRLLTRVSLGADWLWYP